jgi:hypothetical protein
MKFQVTNKKLNNHGPKSNCRVAWAQKQAIGAVTVYSRARIEGITRSSIEPVVKGRRVISSTILSV